MLNIRPSALPGYLDCRRRGAVTLFGDEIKSAGFHLNSFTLSISAKIGTALHKGGAEMLRQVQNSGGYLTRQEINEAVEAAIDSLDEDLLNSTGVVFDKTTRDDQDARKQLEKMCFALVPILQTIEPTHIEHTLSGTFSPLGEQAITIAVEGTLDVRDNRKIVYDHKSGADVPFAHAQIGLYSLLCKVNDIETEATKLIYVPRTRGEQPLAEVIPFDIDECEEIAWETMRSIQYDYERWLETRSPTVFNPNAMSRLCTANYCRSYNTPWCKVGAEVHG